MKEDTLRRCAVLLLESAAPELSCERDLQGRAVAVPFAFCSTEQVILSHHLSGYSCFLHKVLLYGSLSLQKQLLLIQL